MRHTYLSLVVMVSTVWTLSAFSALAQQAPPTLTSVTPSPITPGAVVTITGSGLVSSSEVVFQYPGQSAGWVIYFTEATGTSLRFTVPTYIPGGQYMVSVRNHLGASNALAAVVSSQVTPTPNPSPTLTPSPLPSPNPSTAPTPSSSPNPSTGRPVITGIDPSSAISGSGVTVRVSGSGFASYSELLLIDSSGTRWSLFQARLEGGSLVFTLPSYFGAGTHNLAVRNGLLESAPAPFVVTAAQPTPSPLPSPFPTVSPTPFPTTSPSPCPLGFLPPCPTPSPTPLPTVTPSPQPNIRHYVVLGDSVAVGLWGFPPYQIRYGEALEAALGQSVQLNNLAENGWTTSHLLFDLRTNASMRQAVTNADSVTWNIGGNDLRAARASYQNGTCGDADNQFCLRQTTNRMKANWSGILSEVNGLRKAGALVRTMDIYNPYVTVDQQTDSWAADGGLNDFQVFKPYFDEVNSYFRTTAVQNNIPIANAYIAYNGANGLEDPRSKDYISFDGFHPNTLGHLILAQILAALGFGR